MNDSKLVAHSASTTIEHNYYLMCPMCKASILNITDNPNIKLCENSHTISIEWGEKSSHLTVRAMSVESL